MPQCVVVEVPAQGQNHGDRGRVRCGQYLVNETRHLLLGRIIPGLGVGSSHWSTTSSRRSVPGCFLSTLLMM